MIKPVILVIDDDLKVKTCLEYALPQYEFIGALNGAEGLKLLARPHEVDLVILDMKMEGLSGIEVLKTVKRQHPGLGVIMLTGFGSKESVVEALRGRADDFIDKPPDPNEVKRKIEKILESTRHAETLSGTGGPAEKIERLLRRNYEKEVTLADAASAVSLSPKYVSRLFKSVTGKNFSQYRIQLRMDDAEKLLKTSSLNINQIAQKIGYQNTESFLKLFKSLHDCTPTEYRKQHPRQAGGPEAVIRTKR